MGKQFIGNASSKAESAKKWYLGAGTVMMTNLVPEGSFETMTKWTTWGTSLPDATQAQHGSYSLNLDTAGKFAAVGIPVPVLGHKYYAREYIKSSGEINPSDCRFEIHGGDGVGLNWVIGMNQGNYPEWTIKSGIVTIEAVNASGYVLRTFALDSKATVWLDNIMLVDLTEAFGAGNEPDLAWCDAHIPYFDGTQPVLCETAPAAARQIKKAYIGDASGVARMFLGGVDVAKMAIGYTGAYTDQPEVTMSGKKYRLLTLTGSGTLTVPEEVTADVWMCGGGGAGGGGQYSFSPYGCGGGGGNIVKQTGMTLAADGIVATIGAGGTGSTEKAGAAGATSFGDLATVAITGVDGASGGGSNGVALTVGKGKGVSTKPFPLASVSQLGESHCAGGGGSEYQDKEINESGHGGDGGSDGSDGKTSSTGGLYGNGGAKGGGKGGTGSNGAGSAATFYGSGGGGGSIYYTKAGSRRAGVGGNGYQGVIYIMIPYEQ